MTARDDGPAQALAEGLAARVARWARAQGADDATIELLRRAALAIGLAHAEGHVCLPLADLIDDARGDPAAALPDLRARLRASPMVGRGEATGAPPATPLVLDDDDRLYLARDFDHERRLAARLARAAAAPPMPIDAATAARLRELFPAPPEGRPQGPDWQQVAAALALRRRLVVISGGPGTGKTTTLVNLLACLLAAEPGCRIALAAPTGKAAARMTDALRARAAHLPAALRARLPTEASTVHRLLGVRPGPERFAHHAGQPLAIDALVVDEASMLDLALARRLLEAVPEHARIVLLGDKDQLAAVESGAVFAELSADPRLSAATRDALAPLCGVAPDALDALGGHGAPPPAGPLCDSAVWFTRTHRFAAGSGIARLAADVNAGRAQAALATLRGADGGSDARWLDEPGDASTAGPGADVWQAMRDGMAPYLDAVRDQAHDPGAVARAWGGFIVLTALRAGPRGVQSVNERLARHARERLGAAPSGDGRLPWFAGLPVMVRRNDPVLRLFNGDVGFVLPDAAGALKAWFPDPSAADGGWRAVPPLRLPPHDAAFAMTVHKAQGSEFDRVLMLLPARANRVLTRELLYTGITRARSAVVIAGGAEVVAAAIASPTRRRSGLLARLAAAVAAAG